MKDYYKILGISEHASQEEIKKQFRTLASFYHPDHNKQANAEEYFKDIYEAYQTLSSQEKKDEYDKIYIEFKKNELLEKKNAFSKKIKTTSIFLLIFLAFSGIFYYNYTKSIGIFENILIGSSISYLIYFFGIILFFDFSGFFRSKKQNTIWQIHSIFGILAFTVIFMKAVSFLNLIIFGKKYLEIQLFLILFIGIFSSIILKSVFYSQESFLQIKKRNFSFVLENLKKISLIGFFGMFFSLIFAYMISSFFGSEVKLLELIAYCFFGGYFAVIFSGNYGEN